MTYCNYQLEYRQPDGTWVPRSVWRLSPTHLSLLCDGTLIEDAFAYASAHQLVGSQTEIRRDIPCDLLPEKGETDIRVRAYPHEARQFWLYNGNEVRYVQ